MAPDATMTPTEVAALEAAHRVLDGFGAPTESHSTDAALPLATRIDCLGTTEREEHQDELADQAAAQALPPLPDTWESYPFHDLTAGDTVRFRIKETTIGVTAYDDGVELDDFNGVFDPVSDWITVLRHAEAAHQKLKEGQRG